MFRARCSTLEEKHCAAGRNLKTVHSPQFFHDIVDVDVEVDSPPSWALDASDTGESKAILCLPSFVELNDEHLRSHGKIGHCELTKKCAIFRPVWDNI